MTVSAPLVMQIVEGAPRLRRWSAAEKEQLVSESCEPGISVSLVARRRGGDPSLLFRWHRRLLTLADPPPICAPVEVTATSLIEIELARGRWLRVGHDVDAELCAGW